VDEEDEYEEDEDVIFWEKVLNTSEAFLAPSVVAWR